MQIYQSMVKDLQAAKVGLHSYLVVNINNHANTILASAEKHMASNTMHVIFTDHPSGTGSNLVRHAAMALLFFLTGFLAGIADLFASFRMVSTIPSSSRVKCL
jgi:hypothetical protein